MGIKLTIEQQESNLNKRLFSFRDMLDNQMEKLCNSPVTGNKLQYYKYGGEKARAKLNTLLSKIASSTDKYTCFIMNSYECFYLSDSYDQNGNYYIGEFHVLPSEYIEKGKILLTVNDFYTEDVRKRIC